MIEAKARVPKMHEASLSSLIVPYGADQTLYVVVDRVSGAKEIRIERTDLDSTIGELIAGFFSDPVRVMSFNTLEHWTQDISTEIATEIQARCDIDGTELPTTSRTLSRATSAVRVTRQLLIWPECWQAPVAEPLRARPAGVFRRSPRPRGDVHRQKKAVSRP